MTHGQIQAAFARGELTAEQAAVLCSIRRRYVGVNVVVAIVGSSAWVLFLLGAWKGWW